MGVRAQLGEAEQALMASLAEYKKLRTTLEQSLQDLGVNGTVGHGALAQIDATITALEAVQPIAQETHEEFEQLRVGLGFRHVAGLPKWWDATIGAAKDETRAA